MDSGAIFWWYAQLIGWILGYSRRATPRLAVTGRRDLVFVRGKLLEVSGELGD